MMCACHLWCMPKENACACASKTHVWMSVGSFFMLTLNWTWHRCLSKIKWINRLWCVHMMWYSAHEYEQFKAISNTNDGSHIHTIEQKKLDKIMCTVYFRLYKVPTVVIEVTIALYREEEWGNDWEGTQRRLSEGILSWSRQLLHRFIHFVIYITLW